MRVFLEIQVRAALAGNNLEGPVRPLLGRVARRARHLRPSSCAQIEAVLRIQRGGFRQRRAAGPRAAAQREQLDAGLPGARDQRRGAATRRSSRPTAAS